MSTKTAHLRELAILTLCTNLFKPNSLLLQQIESFDFFRKKTISVYTESNSLFRLESSHCLFFYTDASMNKDHITKRLNPLFAAPLLAALLATPLQASDVYKWVDENGVTHYGERAPSDKAYSTVKTYGEVPGGGEEAKQRLEQQRANKKASEAKDLDYAQQKKIADEQAKVRAENCKGARSNLKTIQENARVRILGEDGEFRYLTEEERQQQVVSAKETIAENCDD